MGKAVSKTMNHISPKYHSRIKTWFSFINKQVGTWAAWATVITLILVLYQIFGFPIVKECRCRVSERTIPATGPSRIEREGIELCRLNTIFRVSWWLPEKTEHLTSNQMPSCMATHDPWTEKGF